jgi:8-oxo-dGTP pyrophosphatase MutT (NUDIX family)
LIFAGLDPFYGPTIRAHRVRPPARATESWDVCVSFLDRIHACTVFDPANYRPFTVAGETVGFVALPFAALLRPFADVFTVDDHGVALAAGGGGCAARSDAVRAVLDRLRHQDALRGWRDEDYPVLSPRSGETLLTLERAAVPRFGVVATGVHVNGFVRDESGLKMWVGRRSRHKHTAPGQLDQLVAGGRPIGLTVAETLLKEAEEEASIPPSIAGRAVAAGAITYCTERSEGLRRDVLYVYDLELPADFSPVNADDEIEEFFLWPIEQVAETVRDSDRFKFNCALVVIDFLIRNGMLPTDDRDYVAICEGLRSGALAAQMLAWTASPSPAGPGRGTQ